MARSTARVLAALAATCSVVLMAGPHAFVGLPAASGAVDAMQTSTSMSVPQLLDTQLLLARNFGGKFAKAKDLTAPVPDQEGFTDGQVAICLCIALVAGLCAWDLAKSLERGATPNRFKDPKSKGGYITPLYKRFIEMGE